MAKACILLAPWGAPANDTHVSTVDEVRLAYVDPQSAILGKTQKRVIDPPKYLELPWHPTHKIAIATMLEESGEPWVQCPKTALSRAISLLREKGLNPKAGFEIEFGLLHGDPEKGLKPFGRGTSYALFDQFDRAAAVLDDITACLHEMHIPLRMVHAEAAPGQFEVVLGHKDVMEAVHDVVIARIIINAMARRHGLVATFVPCYGDGYSGSGSHVHISLDDQFGTDDMLNDAWIGVSKTGQQFMAGILDALPWLTFLLMSSPLSYARSRPQFWVGAYQMWAYNNKESPIRLVADRTNFEMKQLDGVSNVDIAMAGILMAGIRGIEEEKVLPDPVQCDPHHLPEAQRPCRLPDSLEGSLKEFEEAYQQDILGKVFSNEMVDDLLCMKKDEIAHVGEVGLSAYRDVLMTLN